MKTLITGCAFNLAAAFSCAAQSSPSAEHLKDVIPSLYGGDGITLFAASGHNHSAHFTAQALEQLTILSATLAGRSSPSFNLSPASVFEFDPIAEEYVTVESLGSPTFHVEPASTIGAGRTGFGMAVTTRNYSSINGVDLDDIVIDLQHLDIGEPGATMCVGGPPGACHFFELDIVRLNLDIDFHETTILFGMSKGVTDNLEISLLAPVHKTVMRAASMATIIPHESATNIGFTIHAFDTAPGADTPNDAVMGNESGLGDLRIKAKQALPIEWIPDNFSFVLGADLRLPTGEKDNFQGLPNIGISPKIIASAFWDVGAASIVSNANIGYAVNADIQGGDAFSFSLAANIQSNADWLKDNFSLSLSLLGWKPLSRVGFDDLSQTLTVDGDGDESAQGAFFSEIGVQLDFTAGAFIRLTPSSFLFYEAQIPIDDRGLRANLSHTAGIQFSF